MRAVVLPSDLAAFVPAADAVIAGSSLTLTENSFRRLFDCEVQVPFPLFASAKPGSLLRNYTNVTSLVGGTAPFT